MTLLECDKELTRCQKILEIIGHLDERRKFAFNVTHNLLLERHNRSIFVFDKTQNERGGRIVVRGQCFEDVMAILMNNGYNVQITVCANQKYTEAEYVIDYSREQNDENEIEF